jgi:hypothetical protein
MAWKTNTLLLTTAGALVGCAAPGVVGAPPDGSGDEVADAVTLRSTENVRDDLALLRQLEIADIGGLLHSYPEGALHCYGICPGFEDEVEAENLRQAERLSTLVDIALASAEVEPSAALCTEAVIDANLAALGDLQIVEVFGLVEEVPQNNPYCYNLPCPEDIERADDLNCRRATALSAIVAETEGL